MFQRFDRPSHRERLTALLQGAATAFNLSGNATYLTLPASDEEARQTDLDAVLSDRAAVMADFHQVQKRNLSDPHR